MKKKVEKKVVDLPEEVVELKDKQVDSDEKKAFEELIAKYKEQNPEKYEAKKVALEKKLAAL